MKALNRRNFPGGTAGAISGAVLLSTDHAAEGSNQSFHWNKRLMPYIRSLVDTLIETLNSLTIRHIQEYRIETISVVQP